MRQALAVSGATERKREGIEHKLDRLRGWSRNRIERWLAQVEADQWCPQISHPPQALINRLNGGYNGFSIFTTRMGYLKAGFVEGSTAATR